MNTATRLGAYGAALALVFGGAFATANAVVPESTVSKWTKEAKGHDMTSTGTHGGNAHNGGSPSDSDSKASTGIPGVTSAHNGYLLTPVTAPAEINKAGTLSFRILDADGTAVTRFTTSHEKQLHLIVVRSDGTQFRHVHPTMDASGTWSLPWQWSEAGTYRVYSDFVPDSNGESKPITLTRTVQVAGPFRPVAPQSSSTATVSGYTVNLTGDLTAGTGSELTFAVSKGGKPVTELEPYLGAFGHLVALRDGDLAFLHVHPEGDEPSAGDTAGPDIGFVAEAPTAGRYLLYLDFQIDGKVHTAPFVVDTTGTTTATSHDAGPTPTTPDTDSETHSGDESSDGHDH